MRNWLKHLVFYRNLVKHANIGSRLTYSRFTEFVSTHGGEIIIGDDCMIHGKIITDGGVVSIGNRVNIRKNTSIFCSGRVDIGKGVIIADNVVITDNNNHSVNPKDRLKMTSGQWSSQLWSWRYSINKPITIKDNVWIGQSARINKGVVIGKNSVIGANAVVTKSVPDNSIAVGNPARVLSKSVFDFPELIE